MPLPDSLYLLFGGTTLLTFVFFSRAISSRRKNLVACCIGWLAIQSGVSLTGFYTVTNTLPPRFLLLVAPPVILLLLGFTVAGGKRIVGAFDVRWLTLLHIVRIPVELCLYQLYLHGQIPELMTFEGRNFDILSGLTAPLIWYFGYVKPTLPARLLIAWNVACLGLLLHIVISAVLSVQTPFQQFAFGQPNVAVLHFPFVWLPCFIVPVVLFAHLACLKKLLSL